MKVRVVLSIDVDPQEWAEGTGFNDVSARGVAEDVKGYVLNHVQQGPAPIREAALTR